MTTIAETKAALQAAFLDRWRSQGYKGTCAGATGFGKTKPAIDEMMRIWHCYKENLEKELSSMSPIMPPKIFLAVPTEKLRDEGWPEEVKYWYGDEGMKMWQTCVKAECYISLHKNRGDMYDLVVLDEVHNITPLSYQFFKNNITSSVMGLTATVPDEKRDPDKVQIIKEIAPVVFVYTLDQGVEDGTIADFEIHVVYSTLDSTHRCIKAGTKDKPFMTTEKGQYEFISARIEKLFAQQTNLRNKLNGNFVDPQVQKDFDKTSERIQYDILNRTRFIYNLPSKTKLAEKMMKQLCPGKRTLIFCGSIQQSKILCGEEVYNSKEANSAKFDQFKAGHGEFLGVVNAANEGHNIANLDQALVVQVNSNQRHLVQRVGRTVRVRDNHKAMIWIICVRGTVDQNWTEKALGNFDPNKIFYHDQSEFL